MEVAYLVLGWLFGLLSPQISDAIRRRYDRKRLISCFLDELKALRLKLALGAYRLRSHLGTVDDDFVAFLDPIIQGFEGPDIDKSAFGAFNTLKTLSNEQRRAIHVATREPGRGIRPGKLSVPFISAQL